MLVYLLRKIQTLRVNNWRVLRIKNSKLSKYGFYMSPNILRNFQTCIRIPLKLEANLATIPEQHAEAATRVVL